MNIAHYLQIVLVIGKYTDEGFFLVVGGSEGGYYVGRFFHGGIYHGGREFP